MLGLTDSVDLLMWMFTFFEVLFPFKCQNLQDHVLGSTPFLLLSEICLALGIICSRDCLSHLTSSHVFHLSETFPWLKIPGGQIYWSLLGI